MFVAASSTLPPALALVVSHHLLHHQMLGPDMRIADAFKFIIQNSVLSLSFVCTNRHFVCTKQKYFLGSSEKG